MKRTKGRKGFVPACLVGAALLAGGPVACGGSDFEEPSPPASGGAAGQAGAAGAAGGAGGKTGAGGVEAGAETGPEVGPESGPDTKVEAGDDTSVEAGPDATQDANDAPTESATDASEDAALDTVSESAPDAGDAGAGIDAGEDSSADSAQEAAPEAGEDGSTDVAGDAPVEAGLDGAKEVGSDAAPETGAEAGPPMVDYAVTSLSMPASTMMGESFVATTTIKNVGNADGTTTHFWPSLILSADDATDTPANDFFLMGAGMIPVPGPLAIGAQQSGSQKFDTAMGGNSTPGQYFAFVRLGAGAETEITLANNIYKLPTQITISPFVGTDVTIETYPTADPDVLRTNLQIYRSDGVTIAPNFWGASTEKADGYAKWTGKLPSGTFYVNVGSYMTSPFGAYGILFYKGGETPVYTPQAVGMNHATADAYEPDDDFTQSTTLQDNVQQNHTITDVPINYYDWFTIVMP
jgi:hypothetical protein